MVDAIYYNSGQEHLLPTYALMFVGAPLSFIVSMLFEGLLYSFPQWAQGAALSSWVQVPVMSLSPTVQAVLLLWLTRPSKNRRVPPV